MSVILFGLLLFSLLICNSSFYINYWNFIDAAVAVPAAYNSASGYIYCQCGAPRIRCSMGGPERADIGEKAQARSRKG